MRRVSGITAGLLGAALLSFSAHAQDDQQPSEQREQQREEQQREEQQAEDLRQLDEEAFRGEEGAFFEEEEPAFGEEAQLGESARGGETQLEEQGLFGEPAALGEEGLFGERAMLEEEPFGEAAPPRPEQLQERIQQIETQLQDEHGLRQADLTQARNEISRYLEDQENEQPLADVARAAAEQGCRGECLATMLQALNNLTEQGISPSQAASALQSGLERESQRAPEATKDREFAQRAAARAQQSVGGQQGRQREQPQMQQEEQPQEAQEQPQEEEQLQEAQEQQEQQEQQRQEQQQ